MGRKKGFRIFLQALLVIFLLEISLRVLFYQRTAKEPLAIWQTWQNIRSKLHVAQPTFLYKGYFLARPDSSEAVNEAIAGEVFASNRFQYSPWVDFRNVDFDGRYIRTHGLIRTSAPDAFINPESPDVLTIYFLGGSTLYGENLTDRETIPSAFVNLYRARYGHGRSIRVVNYGICAYYSYNELILLSHLLFSGQRPAMVVVLDGLNDLLLTKAAEKRWPYYYYHLRAAGRDTLNYSELYHINDSTLTLLSLPHSDTAVRKLSDSLVSNYLSNLRNIKELAIAHGAKPWFFIQPNPFYGYPNRKNDPICADYRDPVIEHAYSILEKAADSMGNCVFLGNLLEHTQGYPFIDRYHYSPAMSARIAESILDVLGKSINGK